MYILYMLLAFLLASSIMPFFMRWSEKLKFMDYPNERKKHRGPISMAGGVVIYLSFSILYFIFLKEYTLKTLTVFIAATLVFTVGLVDDYLKSKKSGLSALPKFLIQMLAAHLIFFVGISFKGFSMPFLEQYILLPVALQYVLTLLWIFGITTVINFTDGLDGLAGGISCISGTTLLVVSLLMKNTYSALICALLIGSILGYLKYNKHPAKVLMGDAGSTLIGFLLGMVSLEGVFKEATVLSLFIPVLVFGVPIFDNLYVVFRRFKEGKPIYEADRLQVHLRLVDKGFSVKQINVFLYLVTLCLCLIAMQLYWIDLRWLT